MGPYYMVHIECYHFSITAVESYLMNVDYIQLSTVLINVVGVQLLDDIKSIVLRLSSSRRSMRMKLRSKESSKVVPIIIQVLFYFNSEYGWSIDLVRNLLKSEQMCTAWETGKRLWKITLSRYSSFHLFSVTLKNLHVNDSKYAIQYRRYL